jgi:NAD(P)H-flavin reductase
VDTSIREGWTGFIGFVDEEKIRKTMPKEMENAFFAVCGPPRFCSLVEKMLLTQFKVPANQFYRF